MHPPVSDLGEAVAEMPASLSLVSLTSSANIKVYITVEPVLSEMQFYIQTYVCSRGGQYHKKTYDDLSNFRSRQLYIQYIT